jgi:rhodanese-related sulfurtransferase
MERSLSELHEALNNARKVQEELDRRVFHLQTLSDLNSELCTSIRTDELLGSFLLVIMGALGVSQGFALVYDRETKGVRAAVRGLEWTGELSADAAEKLLYKSFGASENRNLAPMSVTNITVPPEVFAEAGIQIEARAGVLFVIDQRSLGIILLGPTLTGAALPPEGKDLLCAHTASFMLFLKNARSFETIQALNDNLVRRNEELRRTIAELTEARHTIAMFEVARARIRSLVQRELQRVGRVNLLDLGLIFLLATVLGVLFNFASPQSVPLLPETLFRPSSTLIEAAAAKDLLDAGKAVLVDARPQELFAQKHINGAINVPSALFEIVHMMKLGNLEEEDTIIVYGRTISKLYDEEVAHRLRQRDHENVKVLAGGLGAWESLAYQVE